MSKRVLVADDDPATVELLQEFLVAKGYEVLTAADGAEALQKVAWRAHSGLFHDETAELCQWHVPSAHYLEMWSDARSIDGWKRRLAAPAPGVPAAPDAVVLQVGCCDEERLRAYTPGLRPIARSDVRGARVEVWGKAAAGSASR